MPHFFIQQNEILDDEITIVSSDLINHIARVLRVKIGETVKFIDENQIQYIAKVSQIQNKFIKAEILESFKSSRFASLQIYLAQAILKPDAQNLVIANATQMGVVGVYPFVSDNTVFKSKHNLEKWRKISDESFKQCERASKMTIFDIEKLENVTEKFSQIIVFAEKYANSSLKEAMQNFDKDEKILVIIGPEGGFSNSEFEFFKQKKLPLISLGNLILKAPNAITAGISTILYEASS